MKSDNLFLFSPLGVALIRGNNPEVVGGLVLLAYIFFTPSAEAIGATLHPKKHHYLFMVIGLALFLYAIYLM